MAKNIKISRSLLSAASLLANAYIAGRAGDKHRAGHYMVAACRTDDLDAVMHGIATAMGISDDDTDSTFSDALSGCDNEDMFADSEEEDLFADDDDDTSDVYSDITADDEEVFADDDDDDDDDDDACPDCGGSPHEEPMKVAIPASCARLSRIRY